MEIHSYAVASYNEAKLLLKDILGIYECQLEDRNEKYENSTLYKLFKEIKEYFEDEAKVYSNKPYVQDMLRRAKMLYAVECLEHGMKAEQYVYWPPYEYTEWVSEFLERS